MNKTVLVAAGEIMSRTVNWQERESCILWGDGAGAVVLTETDQGAQVLSTHIHTDGKNGDNLLMPGGGSLTTPISHESVDKGLHFLKMIGANTSLRVAVGHFAAAAEEAVSANGYAMEDVDVIIPHQANIRIIQGVAKKLQDADGKDLCDHREIREHIVRDRPDSPRRGGQRRDDRIRQARVPHRVRRGTDLGEQPDQVVAAGADQGRPAVGLSPVHV